MVNSSLACLVVAVEVLQVIVEVNRSCAKIAAEKSSVCSKHSCHIDVTLATEGDGYSDLPLVEVGDYGRFLVARYVLKARSEKQGYSRINNAYLAQEPCDKISKDDRLIGLVVAWGGWDSGKVPQIALPLIEPTVCGPGIEQ